MAKHVDLKDIENYVRHKLYPDELNNKVKGQKANFRRAFCKFDIINGQFVYNCNRIVINYRDQ